MQIFQVVASGRMVPPPATGGMHRLVHHLTEALVARGHDVTLVADPTSSTQGRLVAPGGHAWEATLSEVVARATAQRPDVVHFHVATLHHVPRTIILALNPTAVAITIHSSGQLTVGQGHYDVPANACIVTVSHAQAALLARGGISVAATVWNGIPLKDLAFNPQPGDHVAFVGRITPTKGVSDAIKLAELLGRPLFVAGPLPSPPRTRAATEQELLRHRLVRYLGELPHNDAVRLMASAAATLFLVPETEPFGLVMLESLAGGTPVLGFSQGPTSEVVTQGRNGFLAATLDELVEVCDLSYLDRRACRASVEERFTAQAMAKAYEDVYQSALCEGVHF